MATWEIIFGAGLITIIMIMLIALYHPTEEEKNERSRHQTLHPRSRQKDKVARLRKAHAERQKRQRKRMQKAHRGKRP